MSKNIIVTTPKSEMANSAKEAEECISSGAGFYFRRLSRKPKDIEVGKSKVYYVEDGYIRGCGLIGGIVTGEQKCDVTDRIWGDNDSHFLIIAACTWEWIKPVPMKGFQGWRYFNDNGVEIVGGWLDEKPLIK